MPDPSLRQVWLLLFLLLFCDGVMDGAYWLGDRMKAELQPLKYLLVFTTSESHVQTSARPPGLRCQH